MWDDLTNQLAVPYALPDLLADMDGGHHVVATVYAECTSHWRDDGDPALRPVGETQWIAGQVLPRGVMDAIIGYADLRSGAATRPILEAHREAGRGRFAGVRHSTAWDPHPDVPNTAREVPPRTLVSADFVEGVRLLGELGMTFDAWIFFHQIPELAQLAAAAPDTRIVLDHLGGPLCIGPYAADRPAMLATWREHLAAAAARENIVLKIGGLGFPWFVPDEVCAQLTDSDAIADYWRREVEYAIEVFGPRRCMFESNFPVDSRVADYVTYWNAMKKLTVGHSPSERAEMYVGTAMRTYGIPRDDTNRTPP
ncbi:amidohydrolase family protein [Baekduia soli]|uniref:amidohydrolase family protein n=1 Tax=Baekduia soli TaxID=496014 RepID=UPI00225E5061|nr:amidohydrolase family protein [Baekduia soli]